MTIEDTQNLIYGDEGRIFELKKTTGELKDGTKSACAFLNTDGGPRKNMNSSFRRNCPS